MLISHSVGISMLASCPSQKQPDHCVDSVQGLMALFYSQHA